nr:alpha/beta hydrolase [Rhodococcus sp. (in: high G+C Gram-positive bacteria)]
MSVSLRVLAGLSSALFLMVGAASAVQATPINVPWSPDSAPDIETAFESGGITYYGSLRPAVGEQRGAALLLPGSGPTDRNGNQAGGITPNTLAYVADTLAARGVTTFRFDKIGSGRTGLNGVDLADPPGFDVQVDAAAEALDVLSDRSGVSGDRLAVLGHSEGGLTALSLAGRGADVGALGLLAPLSVRYLDLLNAQVNVALDGAVAAGQLTDTDAAAQRGRLAETVDALRAGDPVPYPDDQFLTSVGLNAANARFLAEADAVDPASAAASLPSTTKVLLTCSAKDLNVSCAQTDRVYASRAGTDIEYARLANSSHALGELGPLPASGYDIYVPLPLSSEFRGVLSGWAGRAFS